MPMYAVPGRGPSRNKQIILKMTEGNGMHDCAHRGIAAVIVLALAALVAPAGVAAKTITRTNRLAVAARQETQIILHANMQIPLQGGPFTLYYPKCIRGQQ